MKTADYYEFLQISSNAEPDTIHRVYRFLAGRLHPDNPQTGDSEKFFQLKEAYDVLSDPEKRAAYDAKCKKEESEEPPLSTTIDFMDSIEGEQNRRLVLLGLLYVQRRTNPYAPEVSLFDVEKRMGFPRDYLEFTIWYLRNKGLISQADNSDFTLTAEGVDFVEAERVNIPILNRLLTAGSGVVPTDPDMTNRVLRPATPIIVPSSHSPIIVPAGSGDSDGTSTNGDEKP